MMDLFRHELKKMLLNKKSLLTVLVFILLPVLSNLAGTLSYYNENGSSMELYNKYKPYEGALDDELGARSRAEVEKIIKLQLHDRQAYEEYDKLERTFYFDYSNAADMAYWYTYGQFEMDGSGSGKTSDSLLKPRSLGGTEKRLAQLKDEGRENSYEYRERDLQRRMLLSAGTPGFYYNVQWKALLSVLSGSSSLFIIMMLLLLMAPVFSREYATGMDSILLSSKNGRDKLVTAKIAAAVVTAVLTVLAYQTAELLSYILPGSTINWNAPLNSLYAFFTTPFRLSLLEYYFVQTAFQVIGGIALSLAALFFSSRFKSSLVAFFAGLCFAGYPALFYDLLKIRTDWMKMIRNFSVESALEPANLFGSFQAANLFGNPVPVACIVPVVALMIGLATVFSTFYGFRNRSVS